MSDGPAMSGDCPSVYLYGSKDLADLPKEGTITFKFKRTELAMRDREDRPVSVVLSLKEIVDASEEMEDSEDETEEEDEDEMDSGEALDRKAKKVLDDEEIED